MKNKLMFVSIAAVQIMITEFILSGKLKKKVFVAFDKVADYIKNNFEGEEQKQLLMKLEKLMDKVPKNGNMDGTKEEVKSLFSSLVKAVEKKAKTAKKEVEKSAKSASDEVDKKAQQAKTKFNDLIVEIVLKK